MASEKNGKYYTLSGSLSDACMNMYKFIDVIEERRLPYFLGNRLKSLQNVAYYTKNILIHSLKHKTDRTTITFKCGFHGETGGVFAIASIANLLSSKYDVEFISDSKSNYNKLLKSGVRLVSRPSLCSKLFICDVSCDHAFFEKIKGMGKKIVVSCHGFSDELHGLESGYVKKSLSYADVVHFVSRVQQDSFQLPEESYIVIENTTIKINKVTRTSNAGCVGNLDEKRKNAGKSVEIALKSNAKNIHLYSVAKDRWKCPGVIVHSWESNKNKIYNSFDVLVFLSEVETFGLVVIEAMSAGVPCLLSDIPAFDQYRKCPGITTIDASDIDKATEELNALLKNKENLSEKMVAYFENHYSESAVSKKWITFISDLLTNEVAMEVNMDTLVVPSAHNE